MASRVLLLVASVCLGALGAAQAEPSEAEIKEMWVRFKKEYQRVYNGSGDDETHAFVAFRANALQAYALNVEHGVRCTCLFDDPRCVFGITEFSDVSFEEFAATRRTYRRAAERPRQQVLSLEGLPSGSAADAVDWRIEGAVTEVKNQGGCGSCWAFSTAEEVESQVFMATGKLPTLSTQQIISCDKTDDGCNGGDTVSAYQYLETAGGLDTAADYPDTSDTSRKTGTCTWDNKTAAKILGFTYATAPCSSGDCESQDENALAAALAAKGPVSICVNAGGGSSGQGWQLYKSGIFSSSCSGAATELDHCVQLVGYNKTGTTPYWIVRNSWMSSWGIGGYMHLEMGKNLCGVADEATIVQATTATAQAAADFVVV